MFHLDKMMISYSEIIILSKRNTLFHLQHRAMESTRAIHTTLITPEGEHTFQPTASPPPLLSVAHMSHSPALHLEPAAPSREEPTTASPIVDKRRYFAPEPLDRGRKRRRSLTSDSIDDANINRNIVVPLESLICFIEDNFLCRRCGTKLTNCDTAQPHLTIEVFGLAVGLNYKCVCGAHASLRPLVVPSALTKLTTLREGEAYGTRVNAGDFEINRRFQMGLQLGGDGRQEGKIMAGMLNLNCNPMKNKWSDVQDIIGKVMIEVGYA